MSDYSPILVAGTAMLMYGLGRIHQWIEDDPSMFRMREALKKAEYFVMDVVETRHKLAMGWFGDSELLMAKDGEEMLRTIQAALKGKK